jgi:HPt (histidine-containing phosphotransfer) domain-containing protein
MSAEGSGKLPLVSGDIFGELQADLEDTASAHRYLIEYLQMWEGRLLRLSAAISAENEEAAMDAVLSVRTSAGMIGAVRLAQLAADIEQHLANGDTEGAASWLNELEVCGQLTMEELRLWFLPRLDSESREHLRQDPHILEGQEPNGWLGRADSIIAGFSPSTGWKPRLS